MKFINIPAVVVYTTGSLNRSNVPENIIYRHATTNLKIAASIIYLYAPFDRQILEKSPFSVESEKCRSRFLNNQNETKHTTFFRIEYFIRIMYLFEV